MVGHQNRANAHDFGKSNFFHSSCSSFKENPLFFAGRNVTFWSTQMGITWVWGVRGGQTFFCHKVWTHSNSLGVWGAPKSICTHRHTPLKLQTPNNDKKCHFDPHGSILSDVPRILLQPIIASKASIKRASIHFLTLHPSYTH